jgi:hypothetical protein
VNSPFICINIQAAHAYGPYISFRWYHISELMVLIRILVTNQVISHERWNNGIQNISMVICNTDIPITVNQFIVATSTLTWIIGSVPKHLSLHPILVVIVLLKVLFSTQICCDHCLTIHPFFDIVVSGFHWLTPSDYLVFWEHLQTLFKISTL